MTLDITTASQIILFGLLGAAGVYVGIRSFVENIAKSRRQDAREARLMESIKPLNHDVREGR